MWIFSFESTDDSWDSGGGDGEGTTYTNKHSESIVCIFWIHLLLLKLHAFTQPVFTCLMSPMETCHYC